MKKINLGIILFFFLVILSCEENKNDSQNESIKIGAILSLTGKGASVGEYASMGLQLAVNDVNKNGGVLNKKVELVIEDSKSIGKEGVSVARKLLSSSAPPDLLYVQLSAVSLPVKPLAEKNKTIMFGLSGSEQLISNSNYTFRNWVAPWIAGKELANKIKENFNPKRVGIFYSNDDFGKSMNKWTSSNLKKQSVNVSFSEIYNEENLDYKSLLLKNDLNSVSVIYVVGLGHGLGTIIKQLRELRYEGVIVGDITTPFPNVLEAAGESAKGTYYLDFDFNSSEKNSFSERFRQEFNKEPKTLSAISYDATMLYLKAVEMANSLDDAKVKIELNKIKNHQGTFGKISVKNFDVLYPLGFKKIK